MQAVSQNVAGPEDLQDGNAKPAIIAAKTIITKTNLIFIDLSEAKIDNVTVQE
jgi:hypothetical protein